jgi:hypothetical protein
MKITGINIVFCSIRIETDEEDILVQVSNNQICCETFGVKMWIDIDGDSQEDYESGINGKNIYIYSNGLDDECNCGHSCNCNDCGHKYTCKKYLNVYTYKKLKALIGHEIKDIHTEQEYSFAQVELTITPPGDWPEQFRKSVKCYIKAYTNDNGYYPHEYSIEYPGCKKDSEIGGENIDLNEVVKKLKDL